LPNLVAFTTAKLFFCCKFLKLNDKNLGLFDFQTREFLIKINHFLGFKMSKIILSAYSFNDEIIDKEKPDSLPKHISGAHAHFILFKIAQNINFILKYDFRVENEVINGK